MTYQVLARKWRPKDFASLVGQEHVVRALTHALDGGRLHHAYLFTGTRGVGKTTLSRIFAKALNCETGVTSTPCGVCRACREIDEGRFVDYVEMDAASNRGVDEMAALLERAVYAPVDARFKVYMIDEVHMLTNHAFNAMLKTLEEPPPHVKFILATTDPQKIPVTVLSRCLQFNLKQMPAGHIVSHLERILGEENVPYEAQALRLLARAADGSMRDALSLTDQAIAYSANQVSEDAVRGMLGALDQSYLIRLLDALAQGDGAAVLAIADEMALRSLSFSTALQDLASLLHRVAWAQFAPSSVLDEWPEAADLRRFAETLSAEHVQLFYQIATIGRSELGLAPDEYAGFTMTLLRMLAFEPAPTGGGGGTAGAGSQTGAAGAAGAKRSGAPTVAALRALSPSSATAMAAAAPLPPAAPRASDAAQRAVPARGPQVDDSGSGQVEAAKSAGSATELAVKSVDTPVEQQVEKPAVQPTAGADADAVQAQTAPESIAIDAPRAEDSVPAGQEVNEQAARAADVSSTAAARPLAPWEDAPENDTAATVSSTEPASNESVDTPPASASTAPAAAAPTRAEPRAEPVTPPQREPAPEEASPALAPTSAAADSASRRAGGASAALDVLRNAGMKVSDRGRANPAAAAKPATSAAPKPAAPRVVVPVPTPGAPRRAQPDATSAQAAPVRSEPRGSNGGAQDGSSMPWDDIPPDDYMPLSAADDAYFIPPDDNFVPVFDHGPDDVRMDRAAKSAAPAPVVDTRPLPPAVPLDPLGFTGDWPALAVDLPLKGISYQLAFNSELMALEGSTLKLNVPVPQYAEASQVAKLKAALVERLGRNVDVQVEVGAARRTAAAHDAAVRAQRQQEAEREIRADPFVQSLIREFGASIVDGSIRPITPDAASNGAAPAH
ncbi:DNA polymerase III subunit gamma/tau [Paraburkholderia antibiotica]|uniref:DNA-directed DNA polymerase n=1 Tax=Paraburkholderia antibiotica TaxID=2728839 RepID=A0A7Y0FFB5_9BURK|nr:DNA polymerase III subunit gamma/tau [Paraburkholderia antibiotica]NML34009.1 DNA polymerase III subunit gamma/tau [Paraburkholderia antibiotica]